MRTIFLWILWATASPCLAQWHDNVWLFGYDSNGAPNLPGVDRIRFEFRDSFSIRQYPGNVYLWDTSSALSDSSGNLITLTNGCYIADSSETEIPGSAGLNPGIIYDLYCDPSLGEEVAGYTAPNNTIALPETKNEDRIHFFHFPLVLKNNWFFFKNLLHTVIEKNNTSTGWAVTAKNAVVVQDTISGFGVQAVKHANGRDWWVVCAKDSDNSFYFTLVTPDTILVKKQDLGLEYDQQLFGEMVFSPDGSRLALYEVRKDLQLFDFDRCTGTLSNPVHIPIVDPDSIQYFAGLAWSADGRFLYCSTVKRIYQFDLQAPDLAASMVLVATRNEGGCPISPLHVPADLSYMELAPDGRIFCRSLGGIYCIHVIQHPERKGELCQVDQGYYGFQNDTENVISIGNIPNFPNFRLGPIDGSGCDTLGLDNRPLANWRHDGTGGNLVAFTSVSWYEPTEWWWDFGDPASGPANQSNEKNPDHTFSSPGTYEVCLTVSNANGSDTKCKTVRVSTSSTGEPTPDVVIGLYPNPTTGRVNVPEHMAHTATARVMNTLGQVVAEASVNGQSFDLSGLRNGYYTVILLDGSGIPLGTTKIVIAK